MRAMNLAIPSGLLDLVDSLWGFVNSIEINSANRKDKSRLDVFWISPHQFVISPFVLVHPPEEHEQQINQQILGEGKFERVIVQFPHYLI